MNNNSLLDILKEEGYYDDYNITGIDIGAFKTIPEETKNILSMVIEGYEIEDIAHIKGLSIKAIESRLYRLRNNYEVEYYFNKKEF